MSSCHTRGLLVAALAAGLGTSVLLGVLPVGATPSASVTVRVVEHTESGSRVNLANPHDYLDFSRDNIVDSILSVVPPNSYVELLDHGMPKAGSWSDANGMVNFLVNSPMKLPYDVSLVWRTSQSLIVSPTSIHRYSRASEHDAAPGLASSASSLLVSVARANGSIRSQKWTLSSGLPSGDPVTHVSETAVLDRPQPVIDGDSSLLFVTRQYTNSFSVCRFTPDGHAVLISAGSAKQPAVAAALTAPGSVRARYTWYNSGVTFASDYRCNTNGSNASGTDTYLTCPTGYSNLSMAVSPTKAVWMAGDTGTQILLYRDTQHLFSASGAKPSLAVVDSGATQYVLMSYLKPASTGTEVRTVLFALSGTVVRPERTLFVLPSTDVSRASISQAPNGQIWLFWDQPFLGVRQTFYTVLPVEVK